jgi:hypothetical protein
LLVILQDVNTGQEESFPCEHGTLVVMSQLASGAAEQKYQHAITNSSGNLILVIEGYLLPGKSLKETFELIMNEYASAKGRRDVVGVREPFLLEDPSKETIASAFSFSSDHAIAAKGDVNWNKKENELGLQLAITACGGIENLKTNNVPTDETLLIAFLKRCNLPETVSRKALMQQMQLKRRDSRTPSEIEEKESNRKQLNMFLDSRAEFAYKKASSLKELQKWVNDPRRTNLPEKFKGEVNNVDEHKQQVHIQFLNDQVKARKKIAKAAAKNVSK